ncbi:FAD-linked oxidase C-terminal domain-containing protein [Paeniglutamicibacter antarcticus]|uniref:FAD-linked oxidase C-terminal domain-containing protein n=1 Tax=Paeniglutamicibacter antarcticus TaxID=494023 RepID=UPI001AE3BD2E
MSRTGTCARDPGGNPDDGALGKKQLNTGLNESSWAALYISGTVTAEHGVDTVKQERLTSEQSVEVLEPQRRTGAIFDPQNISGPGKAIC